MADMMEQINQKVTAISLGRKIALLSILAASLAGIVVLWLWSQKPTFQILYSNLSAEDAGAVVAKLKEAHVPYEFSADGGAVLIPSEKVHEMRLQLAGQGLPQSGGIGFEIFDRTSIGTTEFVQKLNYRRALQGELARTIGQLAEVAKARVHVVVPERTLFLDRQEQARASVVVSLRSGKNLSPGQIQGIVHLVSSSVEGLNPQSVTVVDNHGQILSKTSEESSPHQMTSSQLDYQHDLEKVMEGKIQTMLERVVGAGKAVVRVSSVLNFRQVELTEEKFDPNTQVARSEQRSQEKLSGSTNSGPASGPPGVTSNVPPVAQESSNGSTNQNSSQKKNELINYEISKTTSRIIEPTGAIKKLSVAALVDGTYDITKGTDGQTARKYLPRSEDEMKKLAELVKNAVGYSEERKDQVEVVNVAFEVNSVGDDEPVPPETAMNKLAQWLPIAKVVIGLVLALIVFVLVIRPTLKVLLTPSPLPAPPPATSLLPTVQMPMISAEAQMEVLARDQMIQLAKQNPQVAAMVVKKWLKEK